MTQGNPQLLASATASCRIDLFGPSFDLWPLGHLYPGATTINWAIGQDAEVTIWEVSPHTPSEVECYRGRTPVHRVAWSALSQELPLVAELAGKHLRSTGLRLILKTPVPAGSGLGGSSALGIALLTAVDQLHRWDLTPAERVAWVRNIEARILRQPTGSQDHWAAVTGTVQIIDYPDRGESCRAAHPVLGEELQQRSVLVHSGETRNSGLTNWKLFQAAVVADPHVDQLLRAVAALGPQAKQAALDGDVLALLSFSQQEWELRSQINLGLQTPATQAVLDLAHKIDDTCWGRVCGAGGGGAVALFTAPARRDALADAIQRLGRDVLEITPVNRQALSDQDPVAII